ncbi:MAG: metal-dependent transcriptional regulator [Chloroflexi bacterium]|nr:metal-dependent transcriptional regulator [Chloroflexota bacterium]
MVEDPELSELRTEAVEDFLKAVFMLQQRYELVPTTVLAQRLNITPPSATDMAKKLADTKRLKEPLLTHQKYRGVRLTALGERIALEVLRHHRLIELYLVRVLGYTWDEVHEEAERLEHVISERFEERIAEFLGHPEIDPHGDPIPSLEGKMPSQHHLTPLDDWPMGVKGVVARLLDQTTEKLRYLEQKGITPGSIVEVVEREPYDGLTHIEVEDERYVLSQTVTRSIMIANPLAESSE